MMELASALVVGHSSHDILIHSNGMQSAALGGSTSYISSVFNALQVSYSAVSKVGGDFAYHSLLSHKPYVISGGSTTSFISDFRGGERVARVEKICEAIFPQDISTEHSFALGLAVGIVGEVLPETLERMCQQSSVVLCDLQGMIRSIDSEGRVSHRRLEETAFFPLLSKISYLKASRQEAEYLDLDHVRSKTCVLVTEGSKGCTVYKGSEEFHVPAFPVDEVDPTGAGDCFLAGFAAGLLQQKSLEDSVRMGNYWGALAVSQVGIPQF